MSQTTHGQGKYGVDAQRHRKAIHYRGSLGRESRKLRQVAVGNRSRPALGCTVGLWTLRGTLFELWMKLS
jgi:hypothetical protein